MPGLMFQVLADFVWLYLGYAILLTAYTCPLAHVHGKMCSWIDEKQVERLGKTKDEEERAELEEADRFLVQVASDLQDYPLLPGLGIWRTVSAVARKSEET